MNFLFIIKVPQSALATTSVTCPAYLKRDHLDFLYVEHAIKFALSRSTFLQWLLPASVMPVFCVLLLMFTRAQADVGDELFSNPKPAEISDICKYRHTSCSLLINVQSRSNHTYRFAPAHPLDGFYLSKPEHPPCPEGVLWKMHFLSSAPDPIIRRFPYTIFL